MSDPTHRDLCRKAARWLLGQQWCALAAYEVRGVTGVVDAVGVSSPDDPEIQALLMRERQRRYDVYELRMREWCDRGRSGVRPKMPPDRWARDGKGTRPTIAAVEVKRTRSDLLQDLRAGKMLQYQQVGNVCYLAATREALGFERGSKTVLADLTEKGLPTTWGVVLLDDEPYSIRNGRRQRVPDPAEVRLWRGRLARSLSYRVCADGPMSSEAK